MAGFIIRPDTEEPISNEEDSDDDGIATANWQPGTMQVLLPGEDVKFSDPADVGGSHELFQYRTLTQVASAMGLTYFTVTGDMLKANYSNTRKRHAGSFAAVSARCSSTPSSWATSRAGPVLYAALVFAGIQRYAMRLEGTDVGKQAA